MHKQTVGGALLLIAVSAVLLSRTGSPEAMGQMITLGSVGLVAGIGFLVQELFRSS
ncbi:hypothetical protein HY639_02435 [Candidatus Woesearchaeota archaeon]|nr:hypothetical protein [Candidatus Woesearchaeota archaeon]